MRESSPWYKKATTIPCLWLEKVKTHLPVLVLICHQVIEAI